MKYCVNCGTANNDDAMFCGNCGASLPEAAPAPVEEAPEFTEAPVEEAPEFTEVPAEEVPAEEVPAAAAPAGKNPATLWLILSIVLTVISCCSTSCLSFIPGVVGIIMAAIAMSGFKKGDVEGCAKKVKIAKIVFIVGAVLLVLGVIFTLIMNVAGVALGGVKG